MVVPIEFRIVHFLARKVRRIRVEEPVRAVVVSDERFKILILYHHVRHAVFQFPYQGKQPPKIERLRGV